jgi:hypothetical protein
MKRFAQVSFLVALLLSVSVPTYAQRPPEVKDALNAGWKGEKTARIFTRMNKSAFFGVPSRQIPAMSRILTPHT